MNSSYLQLKNTTTNSQRVSLWLGRVLPPNDHSLKQKLWSWMGPSAACGRTHTHSSLKSRVTLHHSSSERKVWTLNIFLLHQGQKKIFFCVVFFVYFQCLFTVHLLNPLLWSRVFWWAKSACVCVCVCGVSKFGQAWSRKWGVYLGRPLSGGGGVLKGEGRRHICWVMIHKKR